jgi:2-hydroxycyclohexanecarboxyl-CoA dehydrogenase
VVIADRDDEHMREVCEELPAEARHVDLADPASIAELVASLPEPGHCSVLVSNAGAADVAPLAESDPETWELMYRVNQRGPMLLTQRLLPGMIETGFGRLVYVSSDAARAGSAREAAYAATKASLFGFAKSVARETARQGVTANVVCPGPTRTPMVTETMAENPELLSRLERAIPMRRLGEPEDAAAAIAWLSSPRCGYVTGQVLSVSGGITMH